MAIDDILFLIFRRVCMNANKAVCTKTRPRVVERSIIFLMVSCLLNIRVIQNKPVTSPGILYSNKVTIVTIITDFQNKVIIYQDIYRTIFISLLNS